MKKEIVGFAVLLACCLFLGATAAGALTAEENCQFKRAKEKGKYEKCVQNWLAKCYGKGDCDQFKLSKCRVKYQNKWTKLQKLTGTTCDQDRFVDNLDGTVTDNLTGLVWEKKTTAVGSGTNYADPTDVDNLYSWTGLDADDIDEDGTVFTDFLANLNFPVGLGGALGWRIPTFTELQTILLPELYPCTTDPCIDPSFGPTQSDTHWSATTYARSLGDAWAMTFSEGFVGLGDKTFNGLYVRAVRGGL